MSGYQRQNGDIVELTAAGLEAVRSHKNNYADSTRPLAMDERRWSAWDTWVIFGLECLCPSRFTRWPAA